MRVSKRLYLVSFTARKLEMEDDLTSLYKWKMTSIILIFLKMEDDLKYFVNGRRPKKCQMEGDLIQLEDGIICFVDRRRPFFGKWKIMIWRRKSMNELIG
jgi:hypothetical protein